MNTEIIAKSFGTHDGTFHADEVTACALLVFFDLIDKDKILRTRDLSKLSSCEFVCDVGGVYDPEIKRFDHHQAEYQGELSSAGMIWKYIHQEEIVDEPTYVFFNRSLILGVDWHDTGRNLPMEGIATFSNIISNFVPPMYDAPSELQNEGFFAALDFTIGHLRRLLARYDYIQSCKQKVADAMAEKSNVLFFEEAMPWQESFFDLGGEKHPALFVVMPSGGHWKLRGIPPSLEHKMEVRVPLPEEWAGLLEEDLKKVSGIKGAIFCHKARFMSVWETKKDALKALEIALKRKIK